MSLLVLVPGPWSSRRTGREPRWRRKPGACVKRKDLEKRSRALPHPREQRRRPVAQLFFLAPCRFCQRRPAGDQSSSGSWRALLLSWSLLTSAALRRPPARHDGLHHAPPPPAGRHGVCSRTSTAATARRRWPGSSEAEPAREDQREDEGNSYSSKTDKASMLDDAIEYLKHLQLQPLIWQQQQKAPLNLVTVLLSAEYKLAMKPPFLCKCTTANYDLSRGGNVEASAKFNSRDHLRAMPGNEMMPVRPAARAGHFDACSIWKNQSPNNPESVLFAPHLHRKLRSRKT